MSHTKNFKKCVIVILNCSTLSPSASGPCKSALANKLGDHVGFASHEAVSLHLRLRRVVHDHVKGEKPVTVPSALSIGFFLNTHSPPRSF